MNVISVYKMRIVWIFNCHPELSWYCSHLELIMHCNGGFCMQFKLQVIPFQSSLLPARVFTWSSSEIDWNNPGAGSRQRLHNWTQSKLQFDPGCLKYFFQTHAFYVFTVIQVDHHKPPPSPRTLMQILQKINKNTYKAVLPVQVGHLGPRTLTFLPSSSSAGSYMPSNSFLCHLYFCKRKFVAWDFYTTRKSLKWGQYTLEEEETQSTSKVTVRLSKWDWMVVTWQ